MRKTTYSLFLPLLLCLSTTNAADKVTHKHGERSHSHVLPAQGLAHQHNGAKAPSLLTTTKAAVTHYHGTRQHSHPLPKAEKVAHKHGISAIGTTTKKATANTTVTTKKDVVVDKPTTTTVKYICSDLTQDTAMSLYKAGHTYLDRDNDGHPCEPTDYPTYTRSTTSITSNCHMVGGYYRKSGTYVRGHMRCR